MTSQDAWEAVRAALGRVAPDVAPDDIAGPARFRQDLELDSLDFLRFLEEIVLATGVDVPESAYGEVGTVQGLVDHLTAHG